MIPETPLRPLHEAAGAQLAEYFGCLMPGRFTDAREEYRFARETVGVVDKNYRAWFDLTGPDRVRYLNAVTSNNIRDLQAGQGIAALLLNAQGHILAELEVYALPDRLRIAAHAMNRARTFDTLEKYIIMDDATIEDVTDRFGAIALEGPRTPALLAELGAPSLDALSELGHANATIAGVACMMLRRSSGGIPSAEFIASRADLPRLWTALLDAAKSHGGAIGYSALNTLRLEAGIPWFGYDFDDTMIPQEAAVEQTHLSFTKGCYTGQEIVERVRSRGHVNRRRAGVAFSGGEVPAAKTPLLADGVEVGRVTRAAFSYALNRPIGFAYLRREHSESGTKLTWAGGDAEVITLPIRAAEKSPAASR
jgi:folate-binding protein YgfZ